MANGKAHMKYQNFSTEDFIQDEFFIEWVRNPDAKTDRFWKSWMAQQPEKLDEIFEARDFIEKLNEGAREGDLSKARTESLWSGIHSQIDRQEPPQLLSPSRNHAKNNFWKAGIAASLLLIASLAALFWYNTSSSPIRYQTTYGEIKEILLPDSSKVFLNANSELLVSGNWDSQPEREVALEGEAFFVVTKQPAEGKRKFVVHTQDFDVVVLGTRFNVINRQNRKRVVLEEGKIDLQLKREPTAPIQEPASPEQKNIQVKPGEQAEFSDKPKEAPLRIEKVNTKVYSSWKTRQLVFDNTPFQELISIIEDNYGYQVKVLDPELLDKELSGSVPSDNIATLLKGLELIFDMKISRKNDRHLEFSKRR